MNLEVHSVIKLLTLFATGIHCVKIMASTGILITIGSTVIIILSPASLSGVGVFYELDPKLVKKKPAGQPVSSGSFVGMQ